MKFKPTIFNKKLAEENQQKQITFSYAKQEEDTYTNLIPFVHCRDFLSDVKITELLGISIEVYGLYYDPKNTPNNVTNIFSLILKFDNNHPEELINFIKNLQYINTLESFYKIKETTHQELTTDIKDDYTYILIEADVFWYSHPITISFYTFFLRCLTYTIYNNTPFWDQIRNSVYTENTWNHRQINTPTYDAKLLRSLDNIEHLTNLVYNFPKFIQNHDFTYEKEILTKKLKKEDIDKYTLHNNLGFISLLKLTRSFNLTLTQQQILEENTNYICPADVTHVIPFLQNQN